MANLFFSKKIIISAIIFSGGLLIAAGILALANFNGEIVSDIFQSSQWAQEAGAGLAVPACTSSSNDFPTCLNGKPKVTVDWSYNGLHGACSSVKLVFRKAAADGPANSRMAYGVINGKFYIAQGSQLGEMARVYNPETDAWSAIASAPTANGMPASAVANNKLYSFGTATHEYDPNSDEWSIKAAPPIDFSFGGQAATVNNIIYVFWRTNAYRYDPIADSWTPLANSPRDHFYMPAVAQVDGIIYVIGGAYTAVVDAYNPLDNSWAQKADIPAPLGYKGYATAATLNSKVYVFGGGHWDNSTAEIWEYNPSTNVWTLKSYMRTKRNVPAAGTIGSFIYVYGGEYPGPYLNNFTVYPGSMINIACPPETNNYTWTDGRSNTAYSYQAFIVGISGDIIVDESSIGTFVTPNCAPFDYSLSNSGGITVNQGLSGSNTITAALVGGTSESVSFSASGLPSGASASFNPISCSPNCSSELTISTTASTPGGIYLITITGAPLGKTTTFNLTVNAPPGDFTLSTGSVACNSVPLSWTASSDADGYRILKGAARIDITPYNPYTALNFTDTAVSENTTYLYQIEAYNDVGTNRSNARNITTPYCPPTLSFSGDPTTIFEGQSSNLVWSSAYTTSCAASASPAQSSWDGSKSLNGNQIVVPLPPPTVTYNLQCSGLGGTTPVQTVVINITPLGLPQWREIIPR